MSINMTNELRLARAEAQAKHQTNTMGSVQATSEIAFVLMAEAGTVDDVTAMEHMEAFAPWQPGIAYAVGQLRTYGEGDNMKLYRCVQAHTSQADWTPDAAASLWSVAGDPAEEWPAWSQPIGAHDAYNTGDQVSHNGTNWVSTVDGNVWEPGVYGWEAQAAE